MATLNFKGKNIIWNHHLSVPYHTLEDIKELSYNSEKAEGNLIIEGDNLLSLKALLPIYLGKIKFVYIDPPYNTGTENWIYNDNVNSPLIQEWLGKEVGIEDTTRHDKWLCMLTPRLKLIKELLSDDGVIFISIDDNEYAHLKVLLDEIFGEDNFIATFVWKTRQASGKQVTSINISTEHEYVICYQRFSNTGFYGIERNKDSYTNPDNDPRGDWAKHPLDVGATKDERPNCYYDLTDPTTGIVYKANPNRVWAFSKESMQKLLLEGKILFGKDGTTRPYLKKFYNELKTERKPFSTWIGQNPDKSDEINYLKVGYNTEGTKTLNSLFEGTKMFDYPKPVSLIQALAEQITNKKDIILDAFAGSGTTAQAVLQLNEQDKGDRKFILLQMSEVTEENPSKNVCKDITRERVKRVITQHEYKTGFNYKKVGVPIDANSLLEGVLPTYKEFAKYVYYLSTGKALQEDSIDETNNYIGSFQNQDIYLIYKQDMEELKKSALNLSFCDKSIKDRTRKNIVYAPACYLDDEYLSNYNVSFVSIPYNLFDKA